MTEQTTAMSVSELIRARNDDGLHALFQEVMESHDAARMAALAIEFLEAYTEFDKDAADMACLENAMELLKAIAHLSSVREPAAFVQTVEVNDPKTGGTVGVCVYRLEGGGMFGIDASYLEQDVGPVFSPYDRGVALDLDDREDGEVPVLLDDIVGVEVVELYDFWCYPCYSVWKHDPGLVTYTRREITRADAGVKALRCIKCDCRLAGVVTGQSAPIDKQES